MMAVLVLLTSDRQHQRLRGALRRPHRVQHTSAASDASRLLRRQSVDVLVIDPLFGVRAPRVAATSAEILALGVEFPFLPVLFYSSDPATALPLIARYPSRECREAIVAGIDDDSSALAQAMERLKNESLVYQVLRPLAERLRDAPPTMVRVLTDVFTTPRLFDTAEQLASAACMSRRSLDRWLTRRQIVPAAELLRLAKAFLAVRLNRDMLVGRRHLNIACGLRERLETTSYVTRVAGVDHSSLVRFDDLALVTYFSHRLDRASGDAWSDSEATSDPPVRRSASGE